MGIFFKLVISLYSCKRGSIILKKKSMPFSQVKSFTYFCVNVTSVIPGSQNTDILRLYLPRHSVLIIAQIMTKLLIA